MAPEYGTYKSIFAACPPPFAFVDLDLLATNMRQIARRASGRRIRIASKSIRCVPIIEKILAAGPAFAGIMCFTAPEAVWLSRQGFDDLLLGYPCWNAEHVRAICGEVAGGKTVVLMVDSLEQIAHLGAIAAGCGVVLPLCLDIDMSLALPGLHFGVMRSPLRSAGDALPLADAIAASPHLRLDGIMGYEAQIAGLGDRMPGQAAKNMVVRVLQRRSRVAVARLRAAVVAALAERGMPLRVVNGGGTGSIESTIREPAVSEVTVGSGFFSPTLFDNYRAFRHQPAAGFAIEIVRRPAADIYTCLGGGYVASGSAGPEKLPRPYLPAGAELLPLEGAGEVQTPIRYAGPERLALGDPIFMRHSKAGELCERFNSLLAVFDGAIVGELPTYRGQGQSFL
ncbi:MAG TPA: amino acid deaminase/aldolase [Herpetosiphonaceae bacterium]|nr:amino acid deaminase/aldolase [Herpetosiphonaceae bacterium]